MPRYYFHLRDGYETLDRDGVELPDDLAARAAGLAYMAEVLLDRPEQFWATGALQLTVTDAGGLSLFVFDIGVTASAAAQPGGP